MLPCKSITALAHAPQHGTQPRSVEHGHRTRTRTYSGNGASNNDAQRQKSASESSPSEIPTVLQFPQQRPTLQTGLHKTPQSGGVQNATSRCDLPSPAVAVRNLVEQAQFAHLCTVMSTMNHRRAGTCVWAGGGGIRWMVDGLCYAIFDTRYTIHDTRYTIHDTLTAGRSSFFRVSVWDDCRLCGRRGGRC